MKTLYIDCGMGAAGDMLTAALLELLPEQEAFVSALNGLGLPGVAFMPETSVKCGIRGTHMSVRVHGHEEHEHEHGHEHHHHHADMHGIGHIVEDMPVSDAVKKNVMAVYGLIAEAESAVHGVPVTEIHFHEVGTLDAIADVTAVCLLMEALAPDSVIASPVHVGSGQAACAHGILPVPAPATAYILKDVPIYGGTIEGELCTPTGAALLKHFSQSFGPMPLMRVKAIGCGMGKKDFPRANCVRAMLGETEGGQDTVAELCCNVDDMTAEELGYAMERLFEAGAREVFTVPAGMKKNRPGTLLTVICDREERESMAERLFRYTSTIGVRVATKERYVLERRTESLQGDFGSVRIKKSTGFGVSRQKPEYDDLARIARERDISLAAARGLIQGD